MTLSRLSISPSGRYPCDSCIIRAQAQWEVYRFVRIYLISRRFFDHARLRSISLGLDLVSDLVSMPVYLDLINVL